MSTRSAYIKAVFFLLKDYISCLNFRCKNNTPVLNKTIAIKSTKLSYDIGLGMKTLLNKFGIFGQYIILKVYILTSTHFIIGFVLRSY